MKNLNFFILSSKELIKASGIYKLNSGGNIYIGSSKNLYSRLMEHRSDLIKNKHSNQFLQNSVNKYGIELVEIQILEFCLPENRIIREKYWINKISPNLNFKDPVTNKLSDFSKQKLSKSIISGRLQGKYKTKYDFCSIEQYNYFGEYVTTYVNKEEASKKLNITKKQIQRIASGYGKGVHKNGIRLRYSNSNTSIKTFSPNPSHLGKCFDFYYINENGKEQKAFSSVKECWKFFGEHLKNKQIILIPKLKFRESGDLPSGQS